MRATVHLLSGAGGNAEFPWMRKKFLRPAAAWDAMRDDTFSYSQMKLENRSHLRLTQFRVDPFNPLASPHDGIIDDVWLVQHNHGSFASPFDPQDRQLNSSV